MQVRSQIWKLCCIPQKRTPSKVESNHHRRELETLFPHFQSSQTAFPFFLSVIKHRTMKVKILKIVRILRAAGPELAFLDEYFFHVKQSHCKLKCVYRLWKCVYRLWKCVYRLWKKWSSCAVHPGRAFLHFFDIQANHAIFVQIFGQRKETES